MITKLIHGDCLIEMQNILDNSVDMVLCDPPYGTTSCKWDSIIDLDLMWKQVKRLIKPNGAIVMTASQPFTTLLISSNIKDFKYCWVWHKDKPSNFALANKQPMKYHEDIAVFNAKIYYKQVTRGHTPMAGQASYGRTSNGSVPQLAVVDRYKGGKTTRNPSSIQKFNTCKHNSTDKSGYHPTQKPVALMEYMIKTYTKEGETVLDFTMGSGTTGVACKHLNRNFIGIELDEDYLQIAKERIHNAHAGPIDDQV